MAFRLFIGFLCCLVLSLACWWLLPRYGLWVPAWLPLIGFAIILAAVLISSAPPSSSVVDDADDGQTRDPLSQLDPQTDVSPYKFRHPNRDR